MIFYDNYRITITESGGKNSEGFSRIKPIVVLFQAVLAGATPLLMVQRFRFQRPVQILTGMSLATGVGYANVWSSTRTVKQGECTVTVSLFSTVITGCSGSRIDLEKNGKTLFFVTDDARGLRLHVPSDGNASRLSINGNAVSASPGTIKAIT